MLLVGSKIATHSTCKEPLDQRTFISFYGRNEVEVLEVWDLCWRDLVGTKVDHLFWTLMYMKLYLPLEVMLVLCDCSKPTFNKWIWVWIAAIAKLHEKVILWENRLRNAPSADVWCLVTVDGTDFMVGEPTPFDTKHKSPKQKGAAVKYEVAISIYSGDIVWIYGPHVGGKHDITIFKELLRKMLAVGEMIETDAGYGAAGLCVGTDGFVRSRDDFLTPEEKREKSELRARHETCNHRFKSWGILKQQFRNDRKKHGHVFYAIAVLTQLQINNGSVLFACEPTHLLKKVKGEYRI